MTEQAPRQNWQADRYAANARFVADLGAPVVELLAPRPGERILDLGCGDGALSERLAALGCTVIGVDAGPDMVAAAIRRGIDAYVADGQDLRFAAEFDAVFSNAALHWMGDADAVLEGVRRALKPGGRFVGEFGEHGNVAAITVALVAVLARRGVDGHGAFPWYFPSAEAYAAKLEAHGFAVDQIALIPRPTPLPTDMAGWLDTFAEGFFGRLPADQRGAARDEALALLAPYLPMNGAAGPRTTSGCASRPVLPADGLVTVRSQESELSSQSPPYCHPSRFGIETNQHADPGTS